MSAALDPRLNAYRPDLANAALRGEVSADRFVDGEMRVVVAPTVDARNAPTPDSGVDTQFLLGDEVRVFEETEGWAWSQGLRDGYVGYLSANALGPITDHGGEPFRVCVPRTFVYAQPDVKHPAHDCLSMGALVHVADFAETRGTRFATLTDGFFCVASHLRGADDHAADYVAIAETLLHAPYLWGGTSGFGVDCSGVIQLAMLMAGRHVLRDSDMQAATIGAEIDPAGGLRRGDLVFWDGHAGIMRDAETLLHANGNTMTVASEPLEQAIDRIARLYGQPTIYRRPD